MNRNEVNLKKINLAFRHELSINVSQELPKQYTLYNAFKRAFDIIVSGLALLIIWPFLLIFSLFIILFGGGFPVIYSSERIGMNGNAFRIYKFRTMKKNADIMLTKKELEEYYEEFKINDDRRITKIGHIYRKLSIDELPQLFNILKGEMSFVGPRPIIAEETLLYGDYRSFLLSVRPGLTGLWQVSGRNKITYKTGERQRLELEYIVKRGFLFDLKIILKTFVSIFRADGI